MTDKGQNNRAQRFLELLSAKPKITFQDFKRIKFDRKYPSTMISPKANNLEDIFLLSSEKHSDTADALKILKQWNRKTDIDNERAFFFIQCSKAIWNNLKEREPLEIGNELTEMKMVKVVR